MTCKCVKKKCNTSCGSNAGKSCNTDADCSGTTKKSSYSIEEFKNITKIYKINYMKGGSKSNKMKSKDGLIWTNKDSFKTYKNLVSKIGSPSKKCISSDGITEYVIWQDPYDKVKPGHFGGLDFLKITNHHANKWHPHPANVFIIAGKYMMVPDHLLGPIKYASETINVEQLFVEEKSNKIFGETGKKGEVLVTGSCASIDISTVTVAFVEDMIKLHKNNMNVDVKLHEEFKAEYDNRINQYIKDGTFKPISWYKRDELY